MTFAEISVSLVNMITETPISFDYKPTQPRLETRYSVQCIVKRPDGTFIRPCFTVRSEDALPSPQQILKNALKHYDKIEESELIKAWTEITTVKKETSHHEIDLES